MKMRIIRRLKIIEVLCVLAAMPCLPVSAAQNHDYTGMVSFGDSLGDLGNTIAILPTVVAMIEAGYNPNFYYDGRFSNGPLWSERLYGQLGFGTMLRNDGVSFMDGTNFSWSGSTSGTGSEGLEFLLANQLTQIGNYSTQLANHNAALPDPATTLFTIWSGGNDVSFLVESGRPITPAQLTANISTAVSNVYALGGRSFLVGNLPPLGFKPNFNTDPVKRDIANAFVASYNVLLANELIRLSATLPDIRIDLLDAYSLFTNVLADPLAYGFNNVTETAYEPDLDDPPLFGSVVPNPNEYLFWDNSHGTAPVSELLTSMAYQSVVPEPSATSMVLLGLVGLAWRRMRKMKDKRMGSHLDI